MIKSLYRFLTLISLIWFVGFLYFISVIPGERQGEFDMNDAIIVLTGGDKRIETGFNLLKEDVAPELFITGVDTRVKRLEELKQLYVDLDPLYKSRITVGQEASDTIGNAFEVKQWLSSKNATKKIVLVTANYHMPRSVLIFKTVLPTLDITPCPVFPPKFNLNTFIPDRRTLVLALQEYHKCVCLLVIKFINGLYV